MTQHHEKPLVISVPEPRSLDLIFTPEKKKLLFDTYNIVETTEADFSTLPERILAAARYIIGQPAIDENTLAGMKSLRCVFNVESNLLDNMPYDAVFARGIHVVTTGAVFAEPVAEIGLGFALTLARDIAAADRDFSAGVEKWGGEGNTRARLISGSEIGIIGFGDLGKALKKLLSGFNAHIRVYDPWIPASVLQSAGVIPSDLETVLTQSDFLFVVASTTSENQGFLNSKAFSKMRKGAAFILLSRAAVVDFDDLVAAVRDGNIVAASDVYPEEPLPADHPVRKLPRFLRSAHRAGALDSAFKRMGDMVLDDMDLIDRNLPPMVCKRAERETVARFRSAPVKIN